MKQVKSGRNLLNYLLYNKIFFFIVTTLRGLMAKKSLQFRAPLIVSFKDRTSMLLSDDNINPKILAQSLGNIINHIHEDNSKWPKVQW